MLQKEWTYRPRIKGAKTWRFVPLGQKHSRYHWPTSVELWSQDTPKDLWIFEGYIGYGLVEYELDRKRMVYMLETKSLPLWLETEYLDAQWHTHRHLIRTLGIGPSIRRYIEDTTGLFKESLSRRDRAETGRSPEREAYHKKMAAQGYDVTYEQREYMGGRRGIAAIIHRVLVAVGFREGHPYTYRRLTRI